MDRSIFNRLSSSLSYGERGELLDRILRSIMLSQEPLQQETVQKESFDPERELKNLSFWERFVLYIKSLFSNKDRYTLVQEAFFNRLAARIAHQYRGLVHFGKRAFSDKMAYELDVLKDCVHTLRDPLQFALGAQKREFVAFLAGAALEYFQEQLKADTDPFYLWETLRADDEHEIRREMLKRFNGLLDRISKEEKSHIYHDARALDALYGLSRQPFDSMLYLFKTNAATGLETGDFSLLENYMASLTEGLKAARFTPSAQGLRALYLFYHDQDLADTELNVEDLFRNDLLNCERALEGIRSFNERVPLVAIMKYINGDPDYQPQETTGGSDWIALYKDFWKQQLEESFQHFLRHRTRSKLTENAREFLDIEMLPELNYYSSAYIGHGITVSHSLSVSFLSGFLQTTFKSMHRPLKLIVLNGDFYKSTNRQDFTSAFDFFVRLPEKIAALENRLASEGDLGSAIEEVQGEVIASPLKIKKITEILARAEKEALKTVEDAVEHFQSLTQLLDGILRGEPGAKFDTLANLDALGGLENNTIKEVWKQAAEQSREATDLLGRIVELEKQEQ